MISNKNIEHFKERFNSLFNENFTVLSEYEGINKKILVRSNSCKHEFMITPTNLFRSKRCPVCSKSKTLKNLKCLYELKDTEKFIRDIKIKRKDADEYTLISEYSGSNNNVCMRHSCGHEFNVRATSFLNDGKKCPFCFKAYLEKDLYKKKFIKRYPTDEYEIITDFVKSNEKMTIRHKKCGNTFLIMPSNALTRTSNYSLCPICREKEKHYSFIQRITSRFNKELSHLFSIEDMSNAKVHDSYITVKHKRCGRIFSVKLDDLFKNKHCKFCSSSIGESLILDILTKKNINFKYKFRGFKDCIYKSQLEFDFVIFNEDGSVKFIIEFDGEQHKRPFRFNTDDPVKKSIFLKKLEDTKIRDEIKNKYCQDNGYILYRIDYKERRKLEELIEKFLEENTISTTIENTEKSGSE